MREHLNYYYALILSLFLNLLFYFIYISLEIHFEVINWSLEEIPRSAITTESDIPGPAPERCGRVHVAQGQRLPQRAPCPPLPATVYHHRHQVVHAVQVYCITGGVEEPEFQWEDHSVRELGVPMELLHVLEPLEVQGQNHGQLFDSHPKINHGIENQWHPIPVSGTNYTTACTNGEQEGFNKLQTSKQPIHVPE